MGVKVDYRTYKNLRGRSSKREGSPFWVKPKDIHKKKHIFGRFGYSLPLTNPGKKRIKNSFEKQSRIRFFGNKDYLHKLRAKRIKSFQQKSHVLIGKRYVKKVDLASFIARMKKIKKLIKTSRIRFWIRFLAKRFFSNRSFKVFYRAMGLSKLNFMNMIKYLIFSRLIFHKSWVSRVDLLVLGYLVLNLFKALKQRVTWFCDARLFLPFISKGKLLASRFGNISSRLRLLYSSKRVYWFVQAKHYVEHYRRLFPCLTQKKRYHRPLWLGPKGKSSKNLSNFKRRNVLLIANKREVDEFPKVLPNLKRKNVPTVVNKGKIDEFPKVLPNLKRKNVPTVVNKGKIDELSKAFSLLKAIGRNKCRGGFNKKARLRYSKSNKIYSSTGQLLSIDGLNIEHIYKQLFKFSSVNNLGRKLSRRDFLKAFLANRRICKFKRWPGSVLRKKRRKLLRKTRRRGWFVVKKSRKRFYQHLHFLLFRRKITRLRLLLSSERVRRNLERRYLRNLRSIYERKSALKLRFDKFKKRCSKFAKLFVLLRGRKTGRFFLSLERRKDKLMKEFLVLYRARVKLRKRLLSLRLCRKRLMIISRSFFERSEHKGLEYKVIFNGSSLVAKRRANSNLFVNRRLALYKKLPFYKVFDYKSYGAKRFRFVKRLPKLIVPYNRNKRLPRYSVLNRLRKPKSSSDMLKWFFSVPLRDHYLRNSIKRRGKLLHNYVVRRIPLVLQKKRAIYFRRNLYRFFMFNFSLKSDFGIRTRFPVFFKNRFVCRRRRFGRMSELKWAARSFL